MAQIGAPVAAPAGVPLTLCQGDGHVGNLVRDADGTLVWADWQAVRIDMGLEDLSFLL